MVPLSVISELLGQTPAPPPLGNTFAVSSVPAASVVVDVKHGIAPDTPPVTVTGKACVVVASVPVADGHVIATLPRAPVGGDTVMAPEVALLTIRVPADVPETPKPTVVAFNLPAVFPIVPVSTESTPAEDLPMPVSGIPMLLPVDDHS